MPLTRAWALSRASTRTHREKRMHERTHTPRVASAEFISPSIFTNAANQVALQAEKNTPETQRWGRALSQGFCPALLKVTAPQDSPGSNGLALAELNLLAEAHGSNKDIPLQRLPSQQRSVLCELPPALTPSDEPAAHAVTGGCTTTGL